MEKRVRLAEMNWMEFDKRIRDDNPIIFVPIGSTEQHGPHLPLSTDVILPGEVALLVAAELGGIVAPAIPYGYKSQPKSGGGIDVFVSKLNSSGNFVWARGMGGINSDRGQGIAVDGSGNVHTTGYFQGTAD